MDPVISNVFDNAIINAQKANAPVDGDYTGDDGLLYCGKCHTPKQVIIKGIITDNQPMKVSAMCDCSVAAQKKLLELERNRNKQAHIAQLREQCFIGTRKRLIEATFNNDNGSNYLVSGAARRYTDNFDSMYAEGKGLMLYGDAGFGKSYIAACIANALIDKEISVIMTNFSRIASQLQKGLDTQYEYYEWLNSFSLLIIDDFGTERKSEYMQEIVYNVIDNRYSAKRPLIVTTNLNVNKIRHLINTDIHYRRVLGRIIECCLAVEVTGRNRRDDLARDNFNDMKKFLDI